MTDKELDYAAEGFAKSYVASIASGTAEEMNELAKYVKAGWLAGYSFRNDMETYESEDDSGEEIIDEDFSV